MLKNILIRVDKQIESLGKFLHIISMIVIFSLMLLTTGDIIGRIFSAPILGAFELSGLALAISVFLSMAATQRHKGHAAIGLIVDHLPKKIQAFVEALIHLVTMLLIFFITWQLIKYGYTQKIGNYVTSDLSLPVYIFVWISALGMLVYFLTLVADFFKSIHKLVTDNES
jgi:TRAP-type C4-dicarboxylate transport system permease small subunit